MVSLSEHGESIRVETVARKVKISKAVLMQYPQVVVLLEQHGYQKRKPRSERVEELLGLVKDAIDACRMSGQPITQERISDKVGITRGSLYRYAEVRTLMTQAANEHKQQRRERRFQTREEELTQQVITALQQFRDTNRRISKKAVAKAVGVSNLCSHYPKVKTLIESAIQAHHTSTEAAVV